MKIKIGDIWRHLKTGNTYTIIDDACVLRDSNNTWLQGVAYRACSEGSDKTLYIRSKIDFKYSFEKIEA